MFEAIFHNCGVFALPQLALSVVTVGLLVAYLLAWARREFPAGEKPWEHTLDPLSGIAVTLGLLGSVVGFIIAFGGFQNGLDVERLTQGLAAAYWTTGIGIVTSLVALLGSYTLGVLTCLPGRQDR